MSAAVISTCGNYRYSLTRDVPRDVFTEAVRTAQTRLLWVMLNPSTADATTDDPTIRKCLGFASRLGFTSIEVVNLFAFRSKSPAWLYEIDEPVGPLNDEHIEAALHRADRVFVAWGQHGARVRRLVAARAPVVLAIARAIGVGVECLGTSEDGSPRHPLMLPYTATPMPWMPRVQEARP